MIVIRFQGRLGNQMFQYALYKELQHLGRKVKADLQFCKSEKGEIQKTELLSAFGIQLDIASKWEVMQTVEESKRIERFIKKHFFGLKPYDDKAFNFPEEIFRLKNAYLDGYWQSSRYFPDVVTVLKNEFRFVDKSIVRTELYDKIHNSNSVSVHIRMGDYLELQGIYGNICTEVYYQKAIEYMRTHIKCPVFFVFSDDIESAKRFLKGESDMVYVDNHGQAYEDLQLMSLCKHNIIANSSFSWWAAWLNNNIKKIVIAPSKWNHTGSNPYIYNSEWSVLINSFGEIQ